MELINNRYIVLDFIMEDICGSVYMVKDKTTDKVLRLKLFNTDYLKEDELLKFAEEFRNVSTVEHPNLVTSYEFSALISQKEKNNKNNRFFYTFENADYETSIDYRELNRDECREVFVKVCRAIQYLHYRGIKYKYLNFDNILITKQDGNLVVKLKDLGHIIQYNHVAKIKSKRINLFMSPEVLWNGEFDHSSDLYALGVLFYYLYYRYDYEYRSVDEVIYSQDENEVYRIIKKAFKNFTDDKYQNVNEFIDDFTKAIRIKYDFSDQSFYNRIQENDNLIGRGKEVDGILKNINTRINERRGYVSSVLYGNRGIGKSILLDEINYRLMLEGISVNKYVVEKTTSEGFPLFSKIICDFDEKYGIGFDIIQKYGNELVKLAPFLSEKWHLTPTEGLSKHLENLKLTNRVFNFICDFAQSNPFVLLLDSVENISVNDQKVIDYLISNERIVPFYLVVTVNTTDDYSYEHNLISNKSDDYNLVNYSYLECGELIQNLLGVDNEDINFVAYVMRLTNGHPSSVVNLINELFREKKIHVDEKRKWNFNFAYENVTETFDYIAPEEVAFLENLGDEVKQVLEFLAVYQNPVSSIMIIEALGMDQGVLNEVVAGLIEQGIINSKFDDWGFSYFYTNSSMANYVANRIEKSEKVHYHKIIAKALEEKSQVEEKLLNEQLIYHLEESEQYTKCIEYYEIYVEQLKKFSVSNEQIVGIYYKAVEVTLKIGDLKKQAKIWLDIGIWYSLFGRYSDAQEVLFKAEALSNENGFNEIYIQTLLELAKVQMIYNNLYESEQMVEKAYQLAENINYEYGIFEAGKTMVNFYALAGKEEHEALINKMIRRSVDHKNNYYLGVFSHLKGSYYLDHWEYEKSLQEYKKAYNILIADKDSIEAIKCINNIGWIYHIHYNDHIRSREYFQEAYDKAIKVNDARNISVYLANIANSYLKDGKLDEGFRFYEQAINNTNIFREKRMTFQITLEMCQLCLEIGAFNRASDLLKKLEMEYSFNRFSKNIRDLYHIIHIEYYIKVKNYDVARSWFGHYRKEMKEKDTSLKYLMDIYDCRTRLFYSVHERNVVNEVGSIVASVEITELNKSRDAKLLREFILENGMELINTQKYIDIKTLLDYDLIYEDLYDDKYLRYQRAILNTLLENDRMSKYEEMIEKYSVPEFKQYLWIIYKLMGDEYAKANNYYCALNHYLTSLDIIRNLTFKLSEEHRRHFILNDTTKIQLKNRINEIDNKIRNISELSSQYLIESEIGFINEYFDIRHIVDLFKVDKFKKIVNKIHEKKYPKVYNSLHEVAEMINDNEVSNIQKLLSHCMQMTMAERGFINIIGEDNEIKETIACESDTIDLNDITFANFHQDDEGILVNNFEENALNNFMQNEMKGVIYMPIIKLGVARKNATREVNQITKRMGKVGVLYLETSQAFNNFSKENYDKIKEMTGIFSMFIENYQLKKSSSIDKLTGVFMRKHFEERLSELISDARSNNGHLAVVMCDIDKFKSINDNYGHPHGDKILTQIGSTLNRSLREDDAIGRYGGEEFILVLPNTKESNAFEITERIRRTIRDNLKTDNTKPITMSFGISCYPDHGLSQEELIEKADQALYYSKKTGRNKTTVWDERIGVNKYRFNKLAGILSGDTTQDATNVQGVMDIVSLLRFSFSKEDKLFEVLSTVLDITKGERGYIVEFPENDVPKSYLKERGSNELKLDVFPDSRIIDDFKSKTQGDYFINWHLIDEDATREYANLKSIIAVPLVNKSFIKGIIVIESPIIEKEFDFNNFNFVDSVNSVIASIIE